MDKILSNRNAVRVIALLIGIFLWVIVRLDQSQTTGPGDINGLTPEVTIHNVSLTPLYDDEHFLVKEMSPPAVTVRAVTSKEVKAGNYRIVLDLTKLGAGTHQVKPKAEGFPRGANVKIEPDTVTVTLEAIQKKQVQVQVDVLGSPAPGYRAGEPVINPLRVHVTVPSNQVGEVDSVRGEIRIDGAKDAVKSEVKLTAYDKNARPIEAQIEPAVVSVEVPVTLPFKTVPLRIKTSAGPPAGYAVQQITPAVEQVTIYGPQDALDKIEFYDGPSLDLSRVTKDETLTVELTPPQGFQRIEPSKLELAVKVVPSETKEIANVPLRPVGLNTNIATTILEPAEQVIRVTVEGAPERLASMDVEDVQALVDVSNLPAGEHMVPVKLSLPAYVKAVGPPPQVKVLIAAKDSAASGTPGGGADSPSPAPSGSDGAASPPAPSPAPTPKSSPSS